MIATDITDARMIDSEKPVPMKADAYAPNSSIKATLKVARRIADERKVRKRAFSQFGNRAQIPRYYAFVWC